MSESIDSLVVSLALDNSNFQQGIQNMNRTIRQATAEFKNSASGVDGYNKSLDGLKGKSEMLSKQVEAQSKIVDMNKEKYQQSKDTLEKNSKAQEELKDKVKAAKDEYEFSSKVLGKNSEITKELKEELDQLTTEYDNNEEKLRNNVRTMENWEIKANNAESKLKGMQSELNKTNKEIELQTNTWDKLSKKLDDVGSKFKKVSEGLTKVGKDLSLKVTASIFALGAGAIKVGMDFEASMSKVKAMSGASGEEMKKLEKAARDAGAATSKSAKDSADALSYMALAGWDVNTSIEGLMPILRLSEAGNIDLARASDLVTDSMSAMGIEVQDLPKYLDVVAQTARSSNTDIDAMMEAYLNVGGVMRGLKVPVEDSALAIGFLANAGKKGSEAGKSLSAIMTNLTAPLGRAEEALDALGFSAFDSKGNFKGMEVVLFDLKDKLKDMTQEQKNSYISMIAGKEHIPTLNALLNGLDDSYVQLKKDISESNGALDEVSSAMRDNLKGTVDELSSAIEELGIKVYDVVKPAIKVVTGFLMDFTNKLNELNPATQQVIVGIAAFAAAVGPVALVLGTLATSVGGILTLLGTLSGAWAVITTGAVASTPAISAVATAFTILSGPVGIVLGALTVLGVGFLALNNHMKKSSLETENFGNNVSESTKKAVEGFVTMNEEASKELTTLSITQEKITGEIANNLNSKFGEMSNTVVEGLKESKQQSLSQLTEMLQNTKDMTEQEKQEIIAKSQEGYDNKVKIVEGSNNRISEIIDNAKQQNRELRAEELTEINLHQQAIAESGIKNLTDSLSEQKAILEVMKSNASVIAAEQSAEVINNSIKQKEQTIKNAEETRNNTVAEILKQRDEIGSISEEQASKLIKEANSQKEETVKQAEEMHTRVVDEAMKQAGEHAKYVDSEVGEVKSKWQMLGVNLKETWKNITSDFKKEWNETSKHNKQVLADIGNTISTSWNNIFTTVKTKVNGVVTSIITKWNEAKIKTSQKWQEIKQSITDSVKELPSELLKVGGDIVQGLINGLQNKIGELKEKAIEIGTTVKNAVKNVLDIHSPSRVMKELGKNTVEGLALGISDNVDMVKKATELAAKTIADVETDLSIKPVVSVSDDILKRNTLNTLKQGEKARLNYSEFLEKLNADEVDRSIKMLDREYKETEKHIKNKIDVLKAGDSKKNKASLDNTRKELAALKENNKETLSLLKERSSEINEIAKEENRIFDDKLNQYDEAIKRLSISTKDLDKDLLNQNAIVILQEQRVQELTAKYADLVKKFGATSEESLKMKKSLEEAGTELIKMGNSVNETAEKIKQSQIDGINDLSNRIKNALKLKYDEELKMQQNSIKAELEQLENWKKESIDKINSVYDSRIKRIDEVTNVQIKALQDELKALDKSEQQKSRSEQDSESLKGIDNLKSAIEFEHNEFNKAELQKKLNQEIKAREEMLNKWQVEDKKESLNQQIANVQENAKLEKEILEIRKQEELARTNDLYTHEKAMLDQTLLDYQETYDRLTEKSRLRAEVEKMIMNETQDEIIKLLHSYEDQYERAGNSLGERLLEGMQPAIDKIMDSISSINSALKNSTRTSISGGVGAVISGGASTGLPKGEGIGSDKYKEDNPDMPDWLGGGKPTVNNNVTINSPKALSHSDIKRETETTLRKLSFSM